MLLILVIDHLSLMALPLKGPNEKSGSPCRSSGGMHFESPSRPLRPIDLCVGPCSIWFYDWPIPRRDTSSVVGLLHNRYFVLCIEFWTSSRYRQYFQNPLWRSLSEARCKVTAHMWRSLVALFLDTHPTILGLAFAKDVTVACTYCFSWLSSRLVLNGAKGQESLLSWRIAS